VTMADIYFSMVEVKNDLHSKGFPDPWWWSSVSDILSFTQYDPYTFEVLLDIKSYWALSWIGGAQLLPEHIWKPIILTGDPTTFQPDPKLVGNGPWKFAEYKPSAAYALLVRNDPNYDRQLPFESDVYVAAPASIEYMHRIPPNTNFSMEIPYNNLYAYHQINATVTAQVQNESGPITTVLGPNATETYPPTHDGYYYFTINYGPPNEWYFYITKIAWWHRWTNYPWPYLNLFSNTIYMQLYAYAYTNAYVSLSMWWDGYHIYTWYWFIPKGTNIPLWGFWSTVYFWAFSHAGIQCHNYYYDPATWYGTIPEDIAGSTLYDDIGMSSYAYKSELPTPDFKVDIKDVARVAAAFGSYPGHPRWSAICDITGDYKVDIKDVARVCAKFGWHA
jgi:hypothetical protein